MRATYERLKIISATAIPARFVEFVVKKFKIVENKIILQVWFDESSQFRVIKWMNHESSGIDKNDTILDLGKFHDLGFLHPTLIIFSIFRHRQRNDDD